MARLGAWREEREKRGQGGKKERRREWGLKEKETKRNMENVTKRKGKNESTIRDRQAVAMIDLRIA